MHRYRPLPEESLLLYRGDQTSYNYPQFYDTISILTWNIGYAGLGKNENFFYDGGNMVIPPQGSYEKNFSGIIQTLQNMDSIALLLLQEVDFNARRSYYVNQFKIIRDILPSYWSASAKNYQAFFVPVPFFKPMGHVHSGLVSLSKYYPLENKRLAFPMLFSWPKSLFMLQRCLLVQKFYVQGSGKYLYVVNLHLSAFSEADLMRIYEMQLLRSYVLKWYQDGNYVIVGGDWNVNPPGFKLAYKTGYQGVTSGIPVLKDFMPVGWKWVYDSIIPTNRAVDKSYEPTKTPVTTLDYFLVSPNIEVLDVKTFEYNFEFSDHQPVYMKCCFIR
ncbi:MAG: endonuclease/exonuclease/phosphatase family protein [Bacteroidales bacterium]|nr:endonuclease/exonuclease/phosphatase family protein [Bacteroidales bacterium]